MKVFDIIACVGIVGVLAACASQPEPMISPEPTFDKFGGGACEEGFVYVPGTAPQPPECIPEDDCDPITLADGSVVLDCTPPPPNRDRDPDRDDSSTTGRDPTTGSSVPGAAPGRP